MSTYMDCSFAIHFVQGIQNPYKLEKLQLENVPTPAMV